MPCLRRLFAVSQHRCLGSFPSHGMWDFWWMAVSLSTVVFQSQYPSTNALLIYSYTSVLYNLNTEDQDQVREFLLFYPRHSSLLLSNLWYKLSHSYVGSNGNVLLASLDPKTCQILYGCFERYLISKFVIYPFKTP